MRITWLFGVGGVFSLLCSIALTLFPMHPEEVESQAAVWLAYAGFSEWAEGLTKTADFWVRGGLMTLLAASIGLVCIAFIRMRRADAVADKLNLSNGWRVSRLIMRVWNPRRAEALCQDFLAQPHKTDEVRVLVAAALRQHRAEGGTEKGSWDFWKALKEAEERHGENVVSRTVTALDKEFPPSWRERCWMTFRQWREKNRIESRIHTFFDPASQAIWMATSTSIFNLHPARCRHGTCRYACFTGYGATRFAYLYGNGGGGGKEDDQRETRIGPSGSPEGCDAGDAGEGPIPPDGAIAAPRWEARCQR